MAQPGKEQLQSTQQELDPDRRVTREEIYPTVGTPIDKLRPLVMPRFGEVIAGAIINGVESGKIRRGKLKLTHLGENPQEYLMELENPEGKQDIDIDLEGDWGKEEEAPPGNPLTASFDGKFYRKEREDAEESIANEEDYIPPDGKIGIGMRGKKTRWYVRLPKKDYPKGGKITKFVAVSGEDVKKGETLLCFVEAIE